MPNATPSSLKWLIDKYVKLAGQVQRKQDQINDYKVLIADYRTDIRELRKQLAQVEAVMRLHEIQIDPKDLRPVRPHESKAVTRYGGITSVAVSTLRSSETKTATTREIVAAVIRTYPEPPKIETQRLIQHRVRIRLCIMAQQGYLVRLPRRGPFDPCSWHLAKVPPQNPSESPVADGADVVDDFHRDSHANTSSSLD
jgi:hypothetical protein